MIEVTKLRVSRNLRLALMDPLDGSCSKDKLALSQN